MNGVWVFVVVGIICVLIAVAVIARLALERAPKERWIDALRNTPVAVKEPIAKTSPQSQVRQVTLGQIWRNESEPGSGYVALPDFARIKGDNAEAGFVGSIQQKLSKINLKGKNGREKVS